MGSLTISTFGSELCRIRKNQSHCSVRRTPCNIVHLGGGPTCLNFIHKQGLYGRSSNFCNPYEGCLRRLLIPVCAVESGMEATITDPKDSLISLKKANIVVESLDEEKLQVRVDLPGEETQKVFDKVLTNLARSAPPIPGFRRQKGGKTSNVPKSFLLQMLGEDRVIKFVIQEIVSSTLADYEGLKVKDMKINTTQTAEELKSMFSPGNDFDFNATMELEKSEMDTPTTSSAGI
ncbi:Trigger factor, ribosome-binding, bacterial [Dillenia turbinata]|uniref:peptidylprolyl isomerase n=1 Tax=Dillenia turbinata TaxID=194707 RepID=A0AAN8YTC2_9MAGN